MNLRTFSCFDNVIRLRFLLLCVGYVLASLCLGKQRFSISQIDNICTWLCYYSLSSRPGYQKSMNVLCKVFAALFILRRRPKADSRADLVDAALFPHMWQPQARTLSDSANLRSCRRNHSTKMIILWADSQNSAILIQYLERRVACILTATYTVVRLLHCTTSNTKIARIWKTWNAPRRT